MKILPLLFAIISLTTSCFSQNYSTFNIEGVERKAIIHQGEAKTKKSPVLFVFHGHGGNARLVERRFKFHDAWKDAIVVYMEGIPGIGMLTDREGVRNGWQNNPGEVNDRDLKFFDEVLKQLQKDYQVDDKRIYAVGHSNGSRFVNVLWAARADKFAAFCAVAGPGGAMIQNAPPKSIWISMGESDPIVPIGLQKRSAELVKTVLKVDTNKGVANGEITTYNGVNGTELIIEDRNAGHEFPIESIPAIVEFFKRNPKK
ncbi:MAG: alpha/beta hydrolase [Pyrinomonadaceae bacterium]|nr:alpha/beta hydrolase [Pyrinomonadaceae bacterium]